jgi:hypothetical protein
VDYSNVTLPPITIQPPSTVLNPITVTAPRYEDSVYGEAVQQAANANAVNSFWGSGTPGSSIGDATKNNWVDIAFLVNDFTRAAFKKNTFKTSLAYNLPKTPVNLPFGVNLRVSMNVLKPLSAGVNGSCKSGSVDCGRSNSN